jgi:uncharacterized protein YdiU (UPF0061 family)
MQAAETDMTLFYRQLANVDVSAESNSPAQFLALLQRTSYEPLTDESMEQATRWFAIYRLRSQRDGRPPLERSTAMNAVNPKYVLRNYLAQLAIDQAEQGDFALVRELLELLRHPYAEQPDKEGFAAKRPDWAKQRAGCSMLSCSS